MPRIILTEPWWAPAYRAALRLHAVLRTAAGAPMSAAETAIARERARRVIDLHRKVSFR